MHFTFLVLEVPLVCVVDMHVLIILIHIILFPLYVLFYGLILLIRLLGNQKIFTGAFFVNEKGN